MHMKREMRVLESVDWGTRGLLIELISPSYIFTANEMCLALYLSLIIGEFVPEEDDHLALFCSLLQIVRIVFSPVIRKQQMLYLQVLIEDHHQTFKELYPDCTIIPKMHYLVHMPRVILQ